jgi:hypothetical protein
VANDGKTEGEEKQYEVEDVAPEVDATPPAKYNFMPHAPAVGAEGIANTNIWGLSADEICAGG